jgi:hypothetical protein
VAALLQAVRRGMAWANGPTFEFWACIALLMSGPLIRLGLAEIIRLLTGRPVQP